MLSGKPTPPLEGAGVSTGCVGVTPPPAAAAGVDVLSCSNRVIVRMVVASSAGWMALDPCTDGLARGEAPAAAAAGAVGAGGGSNADGSVAEIPAGVAAGDADGSDAADG